MEPKLIVIGGYATSGKDAVANILVEELGWYKTYMSRALEKALLTLDPYIPVDLIQNTFIRYTEWHFSVGYDESKKNPEVRRLLQSLGTEVGRDMFDQDVWLNLVCDDVTNKMKAEKNVVVTGIRYPNELLRFETLGALSLWIERPGVQAVNTHSSDNTLQKNDFDICFVNGGTLENLATQVVTYFKERI